MAVGLILKFANLTRTDYEAVQAKLGISDSSNWPAGLLSHVAGAGDDGSFYVSEVWESREVQGTFLQGRLGRALGEAGVTSAPQMTWIDPIYSYFTPKG